MVEDPVAVLEALDRSDLTTPNHREESGVRLLLVITSQNSMSINTKACPGSLSQETQQLLQAKILRRWATYPCAVCGRAVGVEEVGNRWIPERHWPSIANLPRETPVDVSRRNAETCSTAADPFSPYP